MINQGGLPGMLLFYVGMPVILRYRNISTDLKITNGAQGYVRHLELANDPYNLTYLVAVIVEFPSSKVKLSGLPKGYFPVKPMSWMFKHKIIGESGKHEFVMVTREQVPIQPGFALTGHVAQGQTMPDGILTYLGEGGYSAYVAASRATNRNGLFI
ncbi:hypothetical protein IW262DRAFT_1265434, partial [Armillaria fumosa]